MSTTTKQLAEAFLRWPLPKSVRSDECATVQQEGRIGTNLLTYIEAEKMFTDIVGPTLAENAALLIDCDAKRLRLAECRAENAALRKQAVEVLMIGRAWSEVCFDHLSPASVEQFIALEKQILKQGKEAQP